MPGRQTEGPAKAAGRRVKREMSPNNYNRKVQFLGAPPRAVPVNLPPRGTG